MIVELFGAPGSGKSHIAKRLAKEQQLPIVRIRFGQKYALAALFALRHRDAARAFYQFWKRQTAINPLLKKRKFGRLVSFMAKEQKARLLGGAVIDEGILQFFLTVYEEEGSREEVEQCLGHLSPEGYLVCIIEAGPDTRMQRMQARGEISRGELGEVYQRKRQATLDANMALIAPILQSRFRCAVISNDEVRQAG